MFSDLPMINWSAATTFPDCANQNYFNKYKNIIGFAA